MLKSWTVEKKFKCFLLIALTSLDRNKYLFYKQNATTPPSRSGPKCFYMLPMVATHMKDLILFIFFCWCKLHMHIHSPVIPRLMLDSHSVCFCCCLPRSTAQTRSRALWGLVGASHRKAASTKKEHTHKAQQANVQRTLHKFSRSATQWAVLCK